MQEESKVYVCKRPRRELNLFEFNFYIHSYAVVVTDFRGQHYSEARILFVAAMVNLIQLFPTCGQSQSAGGDMWEGTSPSNTEMPLEFCCDM